EAGPPAEAVPGRAGEPTLRDSPQDAARGPGRQGRAAVGLRDGGRLEGGPGTFGVEPGGEHVVRRASERDRSESQRAEGPQGQNGSVSVQRRAGETGSARLTS